MKPGHLLSSCAVLHLVGSPRSPDYNLFPFSPSLHVLYRKDLTSNGHRIQAAVEVLNPLAQFFFPGSDKGKEVIYGHHLVGIQSEGAPEKRQGHQKCRNGGLSRNDNIGFFQVPFLIGNGPGGVCICVGGGVSLDGCLGQLS